MPCGTTTQWQPRIFASAPLESAANTPCGPPSKLSISPAIIALRPSWSSLNCKSSILSPCLAAKSRVDTIMRMPASALALIWPWRQVFSCAAAGPAIAQIVAAATIPASAVHLLLATVMLWFLPSLLRLMASIPRHYSIILCQGLFPRPVCGTSLCPASVDKDARAEVAAPGPPKCPTREMHAMSQKFTLNVNGQTHTVDADPDMPLLYALRNDVGLNNPHFGCGLAQCGACTVHIDGQPIRSCVTPLSAVGNGKVVALAGLGTPEKPHQ